jgi:hypothetical protein
MAIYPTRFGSWIFSSLIEILPGHLFPYRTEKLIPAFTVGTMVLYYNNGVPIFIGIKSGNCPHHIRRGRHIY